MNNFIEKTCSLINLKVEVFPNNSRDSFSYLISEGGNTIIIDLPRPLVFENSFNDNEIEELATLFYNNIWPLAKQFKTKQDVLDFIKINFPDKSPIAKTDRFLAFVYSFAGYDGEEINFFDRMTSQKKGWRDIFLQNSQEFDFYYTYLIESGFLVAPKYDELGLKTYYSTDSVILTVQGLERVVKILEAKISKVCFVAMSFDEEMFRVYNEAIKPAIIETGFEPLLISEKKDIPSDSTINDAILAEIKKSKFTIADFTKHKHGVYFESGYALGRGQKVIYTCRADEIGKAHFDTRNYPHIVWKDAEDFKKQLIDKIEVFIKE